MSNLFQEFQRGNIAIYISGPWYIGEFKNRLDSATQNMWMTAPMPGPNGPGVSLAGGSSLSLFDASKHKREAWILMEYLSQPSVQLQFYRLTGDLPPRKTAWEDTTLANNKYTRAFREQLERVVPTPQVPEWDLVEIDGVKRLRRVFTFDDFPQALAFTNAVGRIAEEEGHHPALLTEWGRTTVSWWTHKIRGLHRNDFIMAAKTDELRARPRV